MNHLHHIDIRHADLLTPLFLAWVLAFFAGYHFGMSAVIVLGLVMLVGLVIAPAFGTVAVTWAVCAGLGFLYRRRPQ